MSAQEIIAELSKLKPEELQLVKAQLEALAAAPPVRSDRVKSRPGGEPPRSKKESLGAFVRRVAGTAEGLPPDLAENHDYSSSNDPVGRRVQGALR
jgi:hypothetical protein